MVKMSFALFIIGIVIALVSAAKTPLQGEAWPDTGIFYGIAIGIAFIGLMLMRYFRQRPSSDDFISSHQLTIKLLRRLLREMQLLRSRIS